MDQQQAKSPRLPRGYCHPPEYEHQDEPGANCLPPLLGNLVLPNVGVDATRENDKECVNP